MAFLDVCFRGRFFLRPGSRFGHEAVTPFLVSYRSPFWLHFDSGLEVLVCFFVTSALGDLQPVRGSLCLSVSFVLPLLLLALPNGVSPVWRVIRNFSPLFVVFVSVCCFGSCAGFLFVSGFGLCVVVFLSCYLCFLVCSFLLSGDPGGKMLVSSFSPSPLLVLVPCCCFCSVRLSCLWFFVALRILVVVSFVCKSCCVCWIVFCGGCAWGVLSFFPSLLA